MKQREIIGHIDCPACGTAGGMRVTKDKNGDPFAYCEAECSLQIRFGGDARRVAKFLARYPWAASVTVPVPDLSTHGAAGEARKRPPPPASVPAVSGSASPVGTLPKAEPDATPPKPPKSAFAHAVDLLAGVTQ